VSDPLEQPADSLAALERVAREADAYLASLPTAPVRLARSNEAPRPLAGRCRTKDWARLRPSTS
jgi:hypothetical protein